MVKKDCSPNRHLHMNVDCEDQVQDFYELIPQEISSLICRYLFIDIC